MLNSAAVCAVLTRENLKHTINRNLEILQINLSNVVKKDIDSNGSFYIRPSNSAVDQKWFIIGFTKVSCCPQISSILSSINNDDSFLGTADWTTLYSKHTVVKGKKKFNRHTQIGKGLDPDPH